MEPTAQLSHIIPALNDLVEQIEPAQLDHPTPCTRFAVRDVLDHMIVLGGTFAALFRGEDPPDPQPPRTNGEVPVRAFRRTMSALFTAVTSPGALERTVASPLGPMPGEQFARFVALDGLVHGWDLATATGAAYRVAPEVVAAVDEFAREALGPELRDGDRFESPTPPPPGATELEQLAAFSGRTV